MVNGLEGDNLKKCMFTMWSRKNIFHTSQFSFLPKKL